MSTATAQANREGDAEVPTPPKEKPAGDGKLRCVVVTPERTVFDRRVDFVALPLYDGELGVLPGRSPLIGRLGYGALRTRVGTAPGEIHFIDGGFAQVRDNVVTVLTSRAIPVAQIDAARAAEELENARSRVATTDADQAAKQRDLDRARGLLRLAEAR